MIDIPAGLDAPLSDRLRQWRDDIFRELLAVDEQWPADHRVIVETVTDMLTAGDVSQEHITSLREAAEQVAAMSPPPDAPIMLAADFIMSRTGTSFAVRDAHLTRLAALPDDRVDPMIALYAIHRRAYLHREDPAAMREILLTVATPIERAARQTLSTPKARTIIGEINAMIQLGQDRRTLQEIARALDEAPDSDVWLRSLTNGMVEIDAAWGARGHGLARDVTEQGWLSFAEHLARARELLEAAWNAAPDRPEPCPHLITVTMGESGDAEEIIEWVERCAKAELDHEKVYYNAMYAFEPRWGNRPDLMRGIAFACTSTNRFDTVVPWVIVQYVESLGAWEGWAILEDDEVYNELMRVLESYRNHEEWQGSRQRTVLSLITAYAYSRGDHDRAKEAFHAVGDGLQEQYLNRVGASAAELREMYGDAPDG